MMLLTEDHIHTIENHIFGVCLSAGVVVHPGVSGGNGIMIWGASDTDGTNITLESTSI